MATTNMAVPPTNNYRGEKAKKGYAQPNVVGSRFRRPKYLIHMGITVFVN